jgi:hypothetical protein
MAKAIETSIDVSAGTLTVDVLGVGRIVVDAAGVSKQNCDYAMYHGFKQRVCDAGALGFNKELARFATNQEKFDAMQAVANHLNSGSVEWDMARTGGFGRTSFLAQAIAELKGCSIDDAKAKVKELSVAERTQLAQHPKVKEIIDRMQAVNVDQDKADELLSSLD